MSNICITKYVIFGDSHKIKSLYQSVKNLSESQSPVWLNDLLSELGIGHEGMDVQGIIESSKCSEEYIELSVKSNAPKHEVFRVINKRYDDAFEIHFSSMSSEYWLSNDNPDDEQSVCLEYVANGIVNKEFYDTHKEAFDRMTEVFGCTIETKEDLAELEWNNRIPFGKSGYCHAIYCEYDDYDFYNE